MSNFEHIFRERTQTEQPFEGRAASWEKLNRQLDAFDAGAAHRPRIGTGRALRLWKLAAAASIAGAAWLGWQNYQANLENEVLKNRLDAVITEAAKPAPVIPEQVATETQPGFSENSQPSLSEKNQPASTETKPVAEAVREWATNRKSGATSGSRDGFAEKSYAKRNSVGFEKSKSNDPVFSRKEILPPVNSAATEIFKNIYGGSNSAGDAVAAAGQAAEIARLTALADSLRSVIALENRLDSVAEFPKIDLKPAPAVASQEARKVSFESKPTESLTRVARRPGRFKVGVQAVASQDLTNIDNKSWAKGQGVTAEFFLKKGVSAVAMADWGTYSFEATKTPKHIKEPGPKENPNHNAGTDHHFEIKKICGVQRVQHYSLGANYALPVALAVRPVVRLGHVWSHFSPISTNFRYEDKPDGGPGGGQAR